MPSLDSVFDLTGLLDKEGFDYVVVALNRTAKNNKANVYMSLKDKTSAALMKKTLEAVTEQVETMMNE